VALIEPLPPVSASQKFLLRRSKFLVGQHTCVVQLRELLQLGREVRRGSRGSRRGWGRRNLLCLRLGVGQALFVGLLLHGRILLLRGCILLGILLVLTVVDRACGPYNYRSGRGSSDRGTGYGSSSSHPVILHV
jgi:hypothetical protein